MELLTSAPSYKDVTLTTGGFIELLACGDPLIDGEKEATDKHNGRRTPPPA